MNEKTDMLRGFLEESDITFSRGYMVGGKLINAYDTTHVGDVTFEEDDDGTFSAYGLSFEHVVRIVRPKAKREVISNGMVGHCLCKACECQISPYDNYCRHCGAELEGGW